MASSAKKPGKTKASTSKKKMREDAPSKRAQDSSTDQSARKKRGPGRPKGSTTKKKTDSSGQQAKQDLRKKVQSAKTELRTVKQESKRAIRRERENNQAVRDELKQALKRERALIKMVEERDEAMRSFGNRWTKNKIAQIQKSPKKTRRRKAAAVH